MSHIAVDNADDATLLYCERPEWQDVTPIPQYDGTNPIAPIFYTPEYKDATEYLRAIVENDEISERVLQLTEDVIRMNPAHYSAWQYRYRTLIALKRSLDVELQLMDILALESLKTYQVWHHRRLLLTALHESSSSSPESLSAAVKELDFISHALETDTKNYHTWSYRQWLLAFFDEEQLWEGELPYVEELLEADVRNNSAWHHRFFVVFGRVRAKAEAGLNDMLRRELSYTKEQIALAPNNNSAWNYLRGILEYTKQPFSTVQQFVELYTVPTSTSGNESVIDLDNPKPGPDARLPCVAALEFLADIHEQAGGDHTKRAIEIWQSLAKEHDTMRKMYWEFRAKEISV